MEVLHWFISGSPAINSLSVVTTYILLPPASECNGSRRRDPFCVRYYVHPTGESVIIIISARAYPPTIIFLLLYIKYTVKFCALPIYLRRMAEVIETSSNVIFSHLQVISNNRVSHSRFSRVH